ncbi:MAG: hypothetical protein GVY18_03570 [Bacteroidetes bacterium]|nr:hypothetical protein [Bacteroidota bacterium]
MKVVEVGRITSADDEKFDGVVLSGTKEEVQRAAALLYADVHLVPMRAWVEPRAAHLRSQVWLLPGNLPLPWRVRCDCVCGFYTGGHCASRSEANMVVLEALTHSCDDYRGDEQ